MKGSWSDERKDRLRMMWRAGMSSGAIALDLGGVSRNAVMGMVNRLGLMGDAGHAAASKRPSGCCSPEWRRSGTASDAVPMDAIEAVPPIEVIDLDFIPPSFDSPLPVPVSGDVVDTPSSGCGSEEILARDDVVVVEPVADLVLVDASIDPPPVAVVETSPDPDVDDVEVEDMSPVVDVVVRTRLPRTVRRPVARDADRVERIAVTDPADRLAFIRATVQAVASRPPSSRSYSPRGGVSRMPPSPRTVPGPRQVVISSGVMARVMASGSIVPEPDQAFSLLEQLTGVPYDARVPGHMPALVAIATVLAKGDPRRVLLPRLPEQSILRVMRSFAERGAVVAGRPPARWLEDVDDRAFYDEMLKLDAA